MARIVLTTFGSLGDLHPFLAVGLELKRRGHQPVIATHGLYRDRVEAMKLEFAPVRPHHEDWADTPELMREAMDSRRGSEVVLQKMVLPYLRQSYDDLYLASRGSQVIVYHTLAFTAPLVAAKLGLPRVSTTLQPLAMFSAHDPPYMPAMPMLGAVRGVGPLLWRPLWSLARVRTRRWFRKLDEIRESVDLPPDPRHPMFDGWSPDLHLVLFSRELGAPQPDWPKNFAQVGFPIHDRGVEGEGMPLALDVFLRQGEPPIVFTLGSSAVFAADSFFTAAAEAARKLNRRAVLLTGEEGLNEVPGVPLAAHSAIGDRVVRAPYAPHSELLPRGMATVHQGGVGTTAQALRAGRPMLVVPFSHDQPDNARRCVRLGVARMLDRNRVNAGTLAAELEQLLADKQAAKVAKEVGQRMKKESGAAGAAVEIERLLGAVTRSPLAPVRIHRKKR